MSLDGKVAIVTGGGSGIGQAAARLFAQNGVKVVVADFDPKAGKETAQEIKSASGDAVFVQVDVSDPEQVDRMVASTLETYKGIDILFNAAAIFMFGTALDTDVQSVEEDYLHDPGRYFSVLPGSSPAHDKTGRRVHH